MLNTNLKSHEKRHVYQAKLSALLAFVIKVGIQLLFSVSGGGWVGDGRIKQN